MGANEYTFKKGYRGTIEQRMSDKTIVRGSEDCWPWVGYLNTSGYGKVRNENGKVVPATHVSFELHYKAKVPPDGLIMHTCDNPCCVNPLHLKIGTKALNNADKMQKGRFRPVRGEQHGMSKLTKKDVESIRNIFNEGGHTFTSLAAMFNVTRNTISNIIHNKNWVKI